MHITWFLAILCAAHGAPFPPHDQTPCPSDCECLTVDLVTTTRCSSLAFVHDAPSEVLNKVSHLDLRHNNLTKLAPIRKLHGLKSVNLAHNDIRHLADLSSLTKLSTLNLRGNKLKTIDLNDLPKNLEHLDLSANHLGVFPDFASFETHAKIGKRLRLREVNLAGNPFVCSCELKAKCEEVKGWAVLVKPVTCRDGSGNVQPVSGLECPVVSSPGHAIHNDLEKMQNDEAVEGSGEEPAEPEEDQIDIFSDNKGAKLEDMENEELLPTATSSTSSPLTDEDYIDNGEENEEEDEYEGSGHSGDDQGEEGSGSEVLIFPTTEETPLKACNFDCSTPLTLDDPETTNVTEPDPNLLHEIGKMFGFSNEDDDDAPSSNETVIETPMVKGEVNKDESERSGGIVPIAVGEEEKIQRAEESEASEVKEAGNPLGLSNNMIVVIALIVVMVCIIVYSILAKRRKNRRHPRRSPTTAGEEMKTIKPTKPARTSLPSADKNKNLPEKVPLMNGQNGAQKNGTPDAATPLINEPPTEKEEVPVQMRSASPRGDHSPLIPEAHRVTVQAKELTAPKTPLLVNRTRSHDGNIITTPESEQRF